MKENNGSVANLEEDRAPLMVQMCGWMDNEVGGMKIEE